MGDLADQMAEEIEAENFEMPCEGVLLLVESVALTEIKINVGWLRDRVLGIHRRTQFEHTDQRCVTCNTAWPCATVRAVSDGGD